MLSDCKQVKGSPKIRKHPVLLKGEGSIIFGKNVQIGVTSSANFYSHYAYLEVRNENSEIIIGNNVAINNNFSAVAFSKIIIGNEVLIGINCSITDTDGHNLASNMRRDHDVSCYPVHIKNNVFLGSNVTVLKGVTIGENSVIGSNSVVTKDIPNNVIAAGNPAVVIKNL